MQFLNISIAIPFSLAVRRPFCLHHIHQEISVNVINIVHRCYTTKIYDLILEHL